MSQQSVERFVCRDSEADPIDDLRQCEAAIRHSKWWTRANLQESWPLTTASASELLADGGEFDIDADGLIDLIDRRLLPRPSEDESGELEWSASDVIEASGSLEGRQQWRPTPSQHDPKKHCTQLILEEARTNNEVELILESVETRFDVRHLLALLVASDVAEGRRKILSLLKVVLQVEHGIIV